MPIKKSLSLKVLICIFSIPILFSCDSDLFSRHKYFERDAGKSPDNSAPQQASTHWEVSQLTEKEIFNVTFSCRKKPYIGEFQSCYLQIKQQGKDVFDAKISIDGGMKMHGHGLPTSPTISPIDATGKYQIEGLEFSMPGEWIIGFRVVANQQTDQIIFKLSI